MREPLDRYLSAFRYLRGRTETPGGAPISRHDTLACEQLREHALSPLAGLCSVLAFRLAEPCCSTLA